MGMRELSRVPRWLLYVLAACAVVVVIGSIERVVTGFMGGADYGDWLVLAALVMFTVTCVRFAVRAVRSR